jgi:predicted metal-dependent HD superfamily phosphohydrolase
MVQQKFIELISRYHPDKPLAERLWSEIYTHYTEKHRHYHTLEHLETVYTELDAARHLFKNWDDVLFALMYHDIIYSTTSGSNEENSAVIAVKALETVSYPDERIAQVNKMILATKAHSNSGDQDVDLFTDADLSILGKPQDVYTDYCSKIRKEYSMFPDFLYNPGRRKVLQSFLSMERVFKTEFFFDKYETTARKNLADELKRLQ